MKSLFPNLCTSPNVIALSIKTGGSTYLTQREIPTSLQFQSFPLMEFWNTV